MTRAEKMTERIFEIIKETMEAYPEETISSVPLAITKNEYMAKQYVKEYIEEELNSQPTVIIPKGAIDKFGSLEWKEDKGKPFIMLNKGEEQ